MNNRQPTEDEIRAELTRILDSSSFEQAERHRRFLSFVVEESLAGRGDRLKGYSVAIAVFDRPEDFDPQADPLVRVEAGRLRQRLAQYYANEGARDPVHISVPRGTYRARFNFLEQNTAPERTDPPKAARRGIAGITITAGLAGAVLALLVVYVMDRSRFPVTDSSEPVAIDRMAELPDWPRVFVTAFTDISDLDDYSSFAYGISEEISLLIGEFELLIIAERPVSAAGREVIEPVPLRSEIDADYVLTGTVRSDDQGARITVRLTETDTGTLIWSEVYDADPSPGSMLETEAEIARQIVNAVAMPYGPIYERELVRRGNRPLAEMTTYDCVLKFYQYRRDIDQTLRADARECFEFVLASGQGVAETSAGLAIIEMDEFIYGPSLSSGSEELLELAGEHARRALDFDSDSYLAHLALMRVRFHSGDVDGAWESAERIIELGPENPIGLSVITTYRLLVGLPVTGPLDPGYISSLVNEPQGQYYVAMTLQRLLEGDFDAASDTALRIDTPNWAGGPMLEAASAALAGRGEIAERSLAQMMAIGPANEAQVNSVLDRFNTNDRLRDLITRGLAEAGLPSD